MSTRGFPLDLRPGSLADPERRHVTDERRVEGISIEKAGDRVIIDIAGGRWEGSAAEAERLLTRLHYVLARVRPGTNIVSMFVNGELWGGKTIETNPAQALADVRYILERLQAQIPKLEEQANQLSRD